MKKPDPDQEMVCSAADRWVEAALKSDDSPFTPGRATWTKEWFRNLRERFIEHPDESSDRFEIKLERQLSGAPAETYQLMGEVCAAYQTHRSHPSWCAFPVPSS